MHTSIEQPDTVGFLKDINSRWAFAQDLVL